MVTVAFLVLGIVGIFSVLCLNSVIQERKAIEERMKFDRQLSARARAYFG